MPNHIIAVPADEDGLRRTFRHVHYAGYINARMRVTGHLWRGLQLGHDGRELRR